MTIETRVKGYSLDALLEASDLVPDENPESLVQVKVSCQGDIAVQSFYPEHCDGVAWLTLSQGPPGEPGRDIRGEVDEGPRLLGGMTGVLIGATDYRSLDSIIKGLTKLRDRLRDGPPKSIEQEICEVIAEKVGEDIAEIEDEALLKMANFPRVTPSDPSSPIPNVGVTPMMLDGAVSLHFSDPSSPIPNVGVTPMMLDGAVSLHFEDGVPDNLAEHMLEWAKAEFLIRDTVLLDQPGMERIVVSCRHHMAGLVEQGFLSRDPFDHSKWIYRRG